VSPASLEKSRIGGMPLRAARVPEAWPLASGRPAAVVGPFTLGAERGGGDGGEDGICCGGCLLQVRQRVLHPCALPLVHPLMLQVRPR
jgi:hypothetical protein